MPHVFRCPHCAKPMQAPEGAEGKKVRCPYCKAPLVIGPPSAPQVEEEAAVGKGGQTVPDGSPPGSHPAGGPRVFISHATPDWPYIIREILPVLAQSGVDTWHSKEDIQTAERWERSIYDGLNACEWFLVVVSANSCKSAWVHREVSWAEKRRSGHIVPVLIEPCDPSQLHLALEEIQLIDFCKDVEAAAQRLAQVWKSAVATPNAAQDAFRLTADLERIQEMEKIRQAAQAGDKEAQYKVALAYETGTGITCDPGQAFIWYQQAAENGQAEAQFDLGYCYQNAKGTAESPASALTWFRKAADQGHIEALTAVGWCYQKGYGVDQDYLQALHFYQQAAAKGDPHALYSIGYCYQFGCGVPKNLASAATWYQQADAKGHPKARGRLRECQPEPKPPTFIGKIARTPSPVSAPSPVPAVNPELLRARNPRPASAPIEIPVPRWQPTMPTRSWKRDLIMLLVGMCLGVMLVFLAQSVF